MPRRLCACWLLWLLAAASARAASAHGLALTVPLLEGAVVAERGSVAAVASASGDCVEVWTRANGTWRRAGSIPREAGSAAALGAGSMAISRDGSLLAVAADSLDSQPRQPLAYVYRLKTAAGQLRWSTAHQLVVRHDTARQSQSQPQPQPQPQPQQGDASAAGTRLGMSGDGRTLVVCYTTEEGGRTRSGGATVFTWQSPLQAQPHANALPVPAGSHTFGSACGVSRDGSSVVVVDEAAGALVYRRSHFPRPPVHRAAGWLPGGKPGDAYRVTAAALSASGRAAVLRVQSLPRRPPAGMLVGSWSQPVQLRVFVGNAWGRWSSGACDIGLAGSHAQGSLTIGPAPSLDGLHVTSTAGRDALVYAVGVSGLAVAHCPAEPVMRSVAAAASLPAASRAAGASPGSPVRTGKLIVRGGGGVAFSAAFA